MVRCKFASTIGWIWCPQQVTPPSYRARLVDSNLTALLSDLPAIMIVRPRAAGKTTTAQRLATTTLRLDEPAVAAAVAADPDAALKRATKPVLLDEWQEVPDVLGAVKRAVDRNSEPGQFILTGSAEADHSSRTWPGTGRVIRVVLHGLTQREIIGEVGSPGPLHHLMTGRIEELSRPGDEPRSSSR
ncbi:MAG: uncharacterized protein QG671_322 [Actinomycetota bacterium]|nr:uncharacterized protein [Actinomycetota bacterium]